MKRKLLLSATLSLSVFFAANAQTVKGKISFVKGQKIEEVSTTNATSSMEMMGQKIETVIQTVGTNLMDVKEVNPTNNLLGITYKRIVMNTQIMGQEKKIDSDSLDDSQPEAEVFKKIIGKSQDLVVDKNGIITEIKQQDDLDNILGEMSGISQAGMLVNASVAYALNIGGGKAVKPGESWEENINTETMKSNTVYTLKAVNGNEAVVGFVNTASTKTKVEKEGMNMVMDLTAKTTGEVVADITTGLVKTRNGVTDASGQMEIMGQQVPMSIKTTMNTVYTKK